MHFDHCHDLFGGFVSYIQVIFLKMYTWSQNLVCSVEFTDRNYAQQWVEHHMHASDVTLEIISYHGDLCDFRQVIVSIMVIEQIRS